MGRARGITNLAAAKRPGAGRRSLYRIGPTKWPEDRLRVELGAFLAGRDTWPTQREFLDAGRGDLLGAIKSHGGADLWARRMRVRRRYRRDASRYTDDDARRDAVSIIAEHGHLPGSRRLARLGYKRLAQRVEMAGGAAVFCVELGFSADVAASPGRPRSRDDREQR